MSPAVRAGDSSLVTSSEKMTCGELGTIHSLVSTSNMATSSRDQEVLNTIFNPHLPIGGDCPHLEANEDDSGLIADHESIKKAKELENTGVNKAENGDLHGALECFNKAIECVPERASGYNNRAQLYRLMGDVPGALDDLNMAINLSHGHGMAAAQSFTQRGMIYRLEGEDDKAVEDFKKGAALGNAFAKSMVVQMNPYAALCNKMLSEAISGLQRGETS